MPRKKKEAPSNVQLTAAAETPASTGYEALVPNALQRVVLDIPLECPAAMFGTAKGTGKSVSIPLKCAQLAVIYKEKFNALITRASYQSLMEVKSLLLYHLTNMFPGTTFNSSENTFYIGGKNFPWGRIELAYTANSPMESERALQRLQGRSFSHAFHDEVGNATSWDFYDRIQGALRGPADVKCQTFFFANPGGPLHGQIKNRWAIPAGMPEVGRPKRFWSEHYDGHCVFMTASSAINEHLNLDGGYRQSIVLMAGGDQDLLNALLYGDWMVDLAGSYFSSCWSPTRCRIKVNPGDVNPAQCGGFVAMDWGSASSTAAYLFLPDPPGSPRGSLVLADEFWIAQTDVGGTRNFNKGTYMPNYEQSLAIQEWVMKWLQPYGLPINSIKYLMDDAQFSNIGTSKGSVAGDFKAAGLPVRRAEKLLTREAQGLATMRTMMAATKSNPEHPWLQWTTACDGWEQTVPSLVRHPNDPETLAPGQPNHGLDAARMGITWHRNKWTVGKGPVFC
ncbi:hypothetical protein N9C85_01040 [Synechococcus sp. AH-224-I15]|nr:hypothetical protein [Synechococcus sp. AH-224-I15]